jgi:3-dehydro-L-gulonate 2-dehydrogenase
MILDMLSALLSGGNSTSRIDDEEEVDISQVFICIDPDTFSDGAMKDTLLNGIIDYVHDVPPMQKGGRTYYPGERTLATRKDHLKNGIPVDDTVWEEIMQLVE